MRLFHADEPGAGPFEAPTYWTPNLDHAMAYQKESLQPFGGQVLYEITVEPKNLLDLTLPPDPWTHVKEIFDVGLDELGEVEEYLAFQILAQRIVRYPESYPYDWMAYPDSTGVTWVYTGKAPLPAAVSHGRQ